MRSCLQGGPGGIYDGNAERPNSLLALSNGQIIEGMTKSKLSGEVTMPGTPSNCRTNIHLNRAGGWWRIGGMRIPCWVLALVTILAPTCLLGQESANQDRDRQGQEGRLSRGAEARMKLRNEVEENWVRNYRSLSPSESMRMGRESTQVNLTDVERPWPARKKGKEKTWPGKRSY